MNPSIIIPARDPEPRLLDRALRSALGIAAPDRIVLIDDASRTPLDPAPLSPRIRVVRSDSPLGVSRARNLGLDHADGDPVIFLDADDRLSAAGCGVLIDLAERTDAVAAIAARWEQRAGRVRFRPVPPEWSDRSLPAPEDVFRPIALFGASGLLVRRDALAGDLRFDPDLAIGEDRDFLYRLARRGPIAVSTEPALTVTLHDGPHNLTSDAHLERRIHDHLALLARHLSPASERHFHQATRWLINRAAKAKAPEPAWRSLIECARAHGWPIPWKARLRRRLA